MTFYDIVAGELEDVDCGASECETDHMAKRSCLPMAVPPGDAIFGNRTCLRFIRSEQVPFDDCRVAPRQQANDITSWLDASFVYGSYDDEAAKLRTKVNGKIIKKKQRGIPEQCTCMRTMCHNCMFKST